jgi:Rrf2 family protein
VIFSASTSHALRALTWLAAQGESDPVMGQELARRLELPPAYLAKILRTLVRRGILRAARGMRGGYTLARSPESIRIIEIIEPFEGVRARPGCLLRPERPCRESHGCSAHPAWVSAKRAYLNLVERGTLADLRGAERRSRARGRRGNKG